MQAEPTGRRLLDEEIKRTLGELSVVRERLKVIAKLDERVDVPLALFLTEMLMEHLRQSFSPAFSKSAEG